MRALFIYIYLVFLAQQSLYASGKKKNSMDEDKLEALLDLHRTGKSYYNSARQSLQT